MKTVFMGASSFAVPALERLEAEGYTISAVYTGIDKPSGRGREVSESPVKRRALELGLEVRQVEGFKQAGAVAAMAELRPDLIVVASFGAILPQSVLEMPALGCLNLHPSLLPRHRGPTPVPAVILGGDDSTGATIMLINERIDSGPVLSQRVVEIDPADTTQTLTARLAVLSAELLVDTIPGWINGSIVPRPQNEDDATYTKMIAKDDGAMDWHLSAVQLWRRVRAYYPWPVCYTSWRGRRLRIIEALPLHNPGGRPGLVVDLGRGNAGVCTGEGVLGLVRVQVEGKSEMGIQEFVRGQRGFIDSVLPLP